MPESAEPFELNLEIGHVWRRIQETARLMVGVPDYETYVEHRLANHPDDPIMSYEEFFRERQESRYGAGRMGRCC